MHANRLSWIIIALCTGCTEPEPADRPARSALASGTFASLASVDGTITTLAYYDGGGVHPGVNAIDIGAPGGAPVYHQLDYLGPDIAGGWVYFVPAHEAGLCSQWYPGDAWYNGAKIYAYTYFYNTSGNFVGSHRAAFQHVDPYDPHMYAWWRWNNAWASLPAWPEGAEITYGNATDGGVYIGAVHPVSRPIYNGPGGGLCTTGSHVHQEGNGWRAGQRYVGEQVAARHSDLHYFNPEYSMPIGGPPSSPTPDPSDCNSGFTTVNAIRDKWLSLGGCGSLLGAPTTNESPTPDGIGAYNHFQGGSIYWTQATGAVEVHGAIREHWAALGWELSVCGYPVTDEQGTPDGIGRYNHFQGCSIYWSPETGAHEVHGAIRERWAARGWEQGAFGYPISDPYTYDGTPWGMPGEVAEVEFERGWISYAFANGQIYEWPK